MTERTEPWWAKDPVLAELSRRAPPGPDRPDPVLAEIISGDCRRELGSARDGLADARDRYDNAVLNARTAGLSWGQIGSVLGVARQELHRRYSWLDNSKPGAT